MCIRDSPYHDGPLPGNPQLLQSRFDQLHLAGSLFVLLVGRKAIHIGKKAKMLQHAPGPVSYTHLDVYKRQALDLLNHLHQSFQMKKWTIQKKMWMTQKSLSMNLQKNYPRKQAAPERRKTPLRLSLIHILEACRGPVYLVTREGDRLNLKSKLCQLVGLTQLIEGGKIAEAFVECEDPEDETNLFRFNLFGKKDS